jgi:hypothetical protein
MLINGVGIGMGDGQKGVNELDAEHCSDNAVLNLSEAESEHSLTNADAVLLSAQQ